MHKMTEWHLPKRTQNRWKCHMQDKCAFWLPLSCRNKIGGEKIKEESPSISSFSGKSIKKSRLSNKSLIGFSNIRPGIIALNYMVRSDWKFKAQFDNHLKSNNYNHFLLFSCSRHMHGTPATDAMDADSYFDSRAQKVLPFLSNSHNIPVR